MNKKFVVIVVSVFIIVMVLPQLLISLLNSLDAMLYVTFGILGNFVKLIFLIGGIVLVPIALVIVLIGKSHK